MESNQKTIGIIIVAHGNYGTAILRAAESITGPLEDCVSISVDVAHDADEAISRLTDAAQRLDSGQGVIILTDMFGGTPTNLALSLLGQHKAEVITGINLPMLLKVIECRESHQLSELANTTGEAGKNGIVVANQMLKRRNKEET